MKIKFKKGRRILALLMAATLMCSNSLLVLAEDMAQTAESGEGAVRQETEEAPEIAKESETDKNSQVKNLKVKQQEANETHQTTVKGTARMAAAGVEDGTENAPYLISSVADFSKVIANPGAWFRQTGDITVTETRETALVTGIFSGVYDGSGYVIKNLTIQSASGGDVSVYAGVFAEVKGIVKNLGVESPTIKSKSVAGGIVARLAWAGSVLDCWVSGGSVSGSNAGGIVGGDGGSFTNTRDWRPMTIENCWSSSAVSGSSLAGGILGFFSGSYLNSCFFAGTLSGGVQNPITNVDYTLFTAVDNCYYDSNKVTASINEKLDIKGKTTVEMKTQSFVTDFLGPEYRVEPGKYPALSISAGSVGNNGTLPYIAITQGEKFLDTPGKRMELTTEILRDASDNNYSFQWYKDGEELADETKSSFVIPAIARTDSGKYRCKISNQVGEVFSKEIMVQIWEGTGTKENPYKVYTAQDFDCVRLDLGAYYLQMKDVDFKNKKFEPIGKIEADGGFKGTYNGGGNKIKNLLIRDLSGSTGIFSWIDGGKIENCLFSGVVVYGPWEIAIITGMTARNGVIENCGVDDTCRVIGIFTDGHVSMLTHGRGVGTNVLPPTAVVVGSYGSGSIESLVADKRKPAGFGASGGNVRSSWYRGVLANMPSKTNISDSQFDKGSYDAWGPGASGKWGLGFTDEQFRLSEEDSNSAAYYMNRGLTSGKWHVENGSNPMLFFEGNTRFLAYLNGAEGYGEDDGNVSKTVPAGGSLAQKINVTKNSIADNGRDFDEYTFKWYKDVNGTKTLAFTTSSATFVIPNISPDDAGTYTCEMFNKSGYTYQIPGSVTVNVEENAGTKTSPYILKTAADFQLLKDHPKSFFVLGNDIDFANAAFQSVSGTFEGSLDGNGYVLKNVNIVSNSGGTGTGLFEEIGKKGIVQNIGIESGTITSTLAGTADAAPTVGALAGIVKGTISHCYTGSGLTIKYNGSGASGSLLGGIAGKAVGTAIDNCYVQNLFTVTNGESKAVIGGITGAGAESSELSGCYFSGSFSSLGSEIYPVGKLDESCFIFNTFYNSDVKYSAGTPQFDDKQGIGKSAEELGAAAILESSALGNEYYLGSAKLPKLVVFRDKTLKCVADSPADASVIYGGSTSFTVSIANYDKTKASPKFTYVWKKAKPGQSDGTEVGRAENLTQQYHTFQISNVDALDSTKTAARAYEFYCEVAVTYGDETEQTDTSRRAVIQNLLPPGLPSFSVARDYWDKSNIVCSMQKGEEDKGMGYVQLQYRVLDAGATQNVLVDWTDVDEDEIIVIGYEGATVEGRAIRVEDFSTSSEKISFTAKKDQTIPVLHDNEGTYNKADGGLSFDLAKMTVNGTEQPNPYEGIITADLGTKGTGFYDKGGSGVAAYYVGEKDVRTKPAASDEGWHKLGANESSFTMRVYENGLYYVYLKDNAQNVSKGVFISVSGIQPNGIASYTYKDALGNEVKSIEVGENSGKPAVELRNIENLPTSITKYESTDKTVASVDASTGVIKGVKYGSAEIRIWGTNKSNKTFTRSIYLNVTNVVQKEKKISTDTKMAVKEGTDAVLKIEFEGSANKYAWYKGTKEEAEGTAGTTGTLLTEGDSYTMTSTEDAGGVSGTASLTIKKAAKNLKGSYYWCVVSNEGHTGKDAVTSSKKELTVYYAPILRDSSDNKQHTVSDMALKTINVGRTATWYTVVADYGRDQNQTTAGTCVWEYSEDNGVTWKTAGSSIGTKKSENIAPSAGGGIKESFTTAATTDAQSMNGWKFRCIIGNGQYTTKTKDTVTSLTAALSVREKPKTPTVTMYYGTNESYTTDTWVNKPVYFSITQAAEVSSTAGMTFAGGTQLQYQIQESGTAAQADAWTNYASGDINVYGNSAFSTAASGKAYTVYARAINKAAYDSGKQGNEILPSPDTSFIAKYDSTAPTGTIKIGTEAVKAADNFWDQIVGNLFYGQNQALKIETEDKESGIQKVEYLTVSQEKVFDEKTEKYQTNATMLEGYAENHPWTEYAGNLADTKVDLTGDKAHIVYVRITNNAGTKTYLASKGIVVDNTPPTATVSYSDTEWAKDEKVTATITAADNFSGAESYYISKTAGTAGTYPNTAPSAGGAETYAGNTDTGYDTWKLLPATGKVTIDFKINGSCSVWIRDKSGKVSQKYNISVQNLDRQAPTFTVSEPPTDWVKDAQTIQITEIADIASSGASGTSDTTKTGNRAAYYCVERLGTGVTEDSYKAPSEASKWTALTEGQTSFTYSAAGNGIYMISVKDTAGNIKTDSYTTDKMDLLKPSITGTAVFVPEWTGGPEVPAQTEISITGLTIADQEATTDSGNSGLAKVYLLNGSDTPASGTIEASAGTELTAAEGACSAVITTPAETTDYYVRALDNAGNWSDPATVTLKVDKTAPVLDGTFESSQSLEYHRITFYLKDLQPGGTENGIGIDTTLADGKSKVEYAPEKADGTGADWEQAQNCTYKSQAGNWYFDVAKAGNYYVRFADKQGNVSADQLAYTLKTDIHVTVPKKMMFAVITNADNTFVTPEYFFTNNSATTYLGLQLEEVQKDGTANELRLTDKGVKPSAKDELQMGFQSESLTGGNGLQLYEGYNGRDSLGVLSKAAYGSTANKGTIKLSAETLKYSGEDRMQKRGKWKLKFKFTGQLTK